MNSSLNDPNEVLHQHKTSASLKAFLFYSTLIAQETIFCATYYSKGGVKSMYSTCIVVFLNFLTVFFGVASLLSSMIPLWVYLWDMLKAV